MSGSSAKGTSRARRCTTRTGADVGTSSCICDSPVIGALGAHRRGHGPNLPRHCAVLRDDPPSGRWANAAAMPAPGSDAPMTVVLIHGGGERARSGTASCRPRRTDRRHRPAGPAATAGAISDVDGREEVASVVADVEAGAPGRAGDAGGALLGGPGRARRGRRSRRPGGSHRPERSARAGRGGVGMTCMQERHREACAAPLPPQRGGAIDHSAGRPPTPRHCVVPTVATRSTTPRWPS